MKNIRPDINVCESLLKDLVRTRTSQPEGNEAPLADWILDWLSSRDSFHRLESRFLDHGGNRKTLIVKIKGTREGQGTAFAGHLDTVDCAENKDWIHPPLEAMVEDGFLYGRGSADMKGGVAAMMLTAQHLMEAEKGPEEPVFFCFTADEEKDGIGALAVAADPCMEEIKELIICEPSARKTSYCEKGALWLKVEIQGISSHASRPEIGRNAIEYAMQFERKFRETVMAGEAHEELGENTMSVTRFNGGVMTNIIPDEAVMEMDIRTVPGTSHEELIRCAKKLAEDMGALERPVPCKVTVMNNRPAVETKPENPLVKRMRKAMGETGLDDGLRGHYFYTDASQLVPGRDLPFVIAGPGDDKVAHCVNEKIDLQEVAQMTEVYIRFLEEKE